MADDTSEPKIITLSSLLENAVPSKKGLYPHEILMLDYANRFPVDFATANYEFQSIKLHQRLFTNADYANIVMAELSQDEVTLHRIYTIAENRVKKQLNNLM